MELGILFPLIRGPTANIPYKRQPGDTVRGLPHVTYKDCLQVMLVHEANMLRTCSRPQIILSSSLWNSETLKVFSFYHHFPLAFRIRTPTHLIILKGSLPSASELTEIHRVSLSEAEKS